MRPLPTVRSGRFGVVTLDELLADRWTLEAVRHAVRTNRLERVAAGRFAPPPPDHLTRFRQADLRLLRRAVAATIGDRGAVSHLGGALHHGLPIWADDPHPCVDTWSPGIRRIAGVHLHRLLDPHETVVRRGGVLVTSAARAIVDIAREWGTEAALVPGDVALRTGVITLPTLAIEVERATGLPGSSAARRVPGLLDPLSESPLESRSRWHFDVHAIDQPLSQIWLFTRTGVFLGRVDHFWPEGVVGEADGRLEYRNPDDGGALDREKRRHQAILDVDLQATRWGAKDLRDFTDAAGRIERARTRARRRVTEGELEWYALDSTGARVPVPGVGRH